MPRAEAGRALVDGGSRRRSAQILGDWGRVFSALSIIASIAAGAWYLEDRGNAKVERQAGSLESRLEKLDARLSGRIAELTRAVDAVNGRLDRLIELQLELTAGKRK